MENLRQAHGHPGILKDMSSLRDEQRWKLSVPLFDSWIRVLQHDALKWQATPCNTIFLPMHFSRGLQLLEVQANARNLRHFSNMLSSLRDVLRFSGYDPTSSYRRPTVLLPWEEPLIVGSEVVCHQALVEITWHHGDIGSWRYVDGRGELRSRTEARLLQVVRGFEILVQNSAPKEPHCRLKASGSRTKSNHIPVCRLLPKDSSNSYVLARSLASRQCMGLWFHASFHGCWIHPASRAV